MEATVFGALLEADGRVDCRFTPGSTSRRSRADLELRVGLATGVPESAENEEHEQDNHDDPEDGHWFLSVVDQYE